MKIRFVAFLLGFVAISALAALIFVNADVAAGDDVFPVPDDTNMPISAPWPDEPGKMPDLIGGKVPDRPLVFSEPSSKSGNEPNSPNAPAIDVWYDTPQKFGNIGNPQQWINVTGNVTGIGSSGSLEYSLNNKPFEALSVGSDGQRLEATGDFNVEIDYADLNAGSNKVEIKASDGVSETMKTVIVNYTAGKTWPGDYTADWSSSSNLQDIAQPVDGNWQLSGNTVYIDEDNWGYDRLLAIGDETWTDYEVTVPVTVYGLDPSGYQGLSNGPAVGMIMRWLGHTNDHDEQPNVDWDRTGAVGWYRWAPDLTEALELRGYDWRKGTSFTRELEFDTEYIFKMSVQSIPGQTAYYRLKFWKSSDSEPKEWDLQGFSGENASTAGSLLLVAHHVDATFGEVTVTNLEDLRLNVNVDIDGEGEVVFSPDQDDFAYGERVFVYALPEYGYDFDRWLGDYTGTSNPADFNIFSDMNMTARFKPKPPTKLTITTEGQGTVNKNPNKSEYLWGEQVALTAVPAGDQIFLRWIGDVQGLQNPTSIIMDEDKAVTAVFGPKSLASPRSDDFSGCELNSNIWDVVNPADDAIFSTTGTKAKFEIPAGSRHDMWSNNSDALRIMQPTEDQNFEIEVAFDTVPQERFQMEGILIQQDAGNWLRFDFHHNGSSLQANAAKSIDGSASNVKYGSINAGSSQRLYIRVERNGNKWTHSYSFNGTDYTTFVVFIHAMEVTSSGIFVGNSALSAGQEPAFTAFADYFFNTVAPIDPEDQGNTVNVGTTGQGQVQLNPLKDTYSCGEQITLRAIPAAEWLFAGWSGDLSGKANPTTITVKGDLEITANFGQGAYVFMPVVMTKK